MKISRETDYAVRCVLYLAKAGDRIAVVNDIAEACQIPKSFLSKILQSLTRAGIVRSHRGPRGGFRLARKAEDTSLLDVIVAIQGQVALNECAVESRLCSRSGSCAVHPVWVKASRQVEQMLQEYDFGKLAREEDEGERRGRIS